MSAFSPSEAVEAEAVGPLSGKPSPAGLRTFTTRVIRLSQVGMDFLTVVLCFLASYWFYTRQLERVSPQTFVEFLALSSLAGVLYVLILERMGLYRREMSLLNVHEMRGIARTGIYAAALIFTASFYVRSTSFSRLTLTFALAATPFVLYIQRRVFYGVQLKLHLEGFADKRVLIYGAGNIGKHLAKRLFESPGLGWLPIGFLDDDAAKHGSPVTWLGTRPRDGIRVLGGEDYLLSAPKEDLDLVILALPSATFERNHHLVELCVSRGLRYLIVPNIYEDFVETAEFFEIGGLPLLGRREHRTNPLYLAAKRLLDFITAAILLLILSPLVIVLGLAIKLDSPGPLIFKQKRVGLKGKHFSIYKFRSMRLDAPKYARTPTSSTDPRITRVGRILRRTSLDELPQLFNVLRGDMSLVGPRPEMPFIVEGYSPLERMRLNAKPGITGLWQISAARAEPIHANMEYDLYYIRHQSLLLDFAILFKTAMSVVRGVGAS